MALKYHVNTRAALLAVSLSLGSSFVIAGQPAPTGGQSGGGQPMGPMGDQPMSQPMQGVQPDGQRPGQTMGQPMGMPRGQQQPMGQQMGQPGSPQVGQVMGQQMGQQGQQPGTQPMGMQGGQPGDPPAPPPPPASGGFADEGGNLRMQPAATDGKQMPPAGTQPPVPGQVLPQQNQPKSGLPNQMPAPQPSSGMQQSPQPGTFPGSQAGPMNSGQPGMQQGTQKNMQPGSQSGFKPPQNAPMGPGSNGVSPGPTPPVNTQPSVSNEVPEPLASPDQVSSPQLTPSGVAQ